MTERAKLTIYLAMITIGASVLFVMALAPVWMK
jgi:hypothetical protein